MKKDLEYVYPEVSELRFELFIANRFSYMDQKELHKKVGRLLAFDIAAKAKEGVRFTVEDRVRFARKTADELPVGLCALMGSLLGKKAKEAMIRSERKTQEGEWVPVVWAGEQWFRDSPYRYTHAIHVSKTNPNLIAYADSIDRLIAERYTTVKPGRYLLKFFGGNLTEDQIRDWAEKHNASLKPAELKFMEHDNPDGWEEVYRDGPESCMSGNKCVRVYCHAKSVLRLAYLEHADAIVARCIVREDKKQYIRVYPGTSGTEDQRWHTALKTALEDAGYVHGNLLGVQLDAVQSDEGNDAYVMPYLDRGDLSDVPGVVWYGDRFIVVRDGVAADSTSGYLEMGGYDCEECGDRVDEDETTYIDGEDIHVCECCLNNRFVYAYVGRRQQEFIRSDEAIEVAGEYYHPDCLSDHAIYECEVSGDYFHMDDLASTSRGWVHINNCVELDEEDSDGNTHAVKEDTAETTDGRTIHEDDAVTIKQDGEEVIIHKNDERQAA